MVDAGRGRHPGVVHRSPDGKGHGGRRHRVLGGPDAVDRIPADLRRGDGEQVASFDDVANVHTLPPPKKSGAYSWTIHNTEVVGDTAFASWYTNGIVALDLSPLNGATPGDPVKVGQFIPTGAKSNTASIPNNLPSVWGVAIRESDGLIFVSDMTSGLWIVRPIGAAAP